jgi:RNase H-fold protein (predicted Holliday junction resolvase)
LSVLQLIEALRQHTAIQIDTEDERMTTALAESERRSMDIKKGKMDRDAVAAAILLESYMQRMQNIALAKS